MATGEMGTFIRFVLTKAEDKRMATAMNGGWSDGGAQDLKDKIECFEAGLAGEIPACLKPLYEEFQKVSNPEYQTYIELRKKFEGK